MKGNRHPVSTALLAHHACANKAVKEPIRDVSGEQKATSAGVFTLCLRSILAFLKYLLWFSSQQMAFRVMQQLQLSDIPGKNHFQQPEKQKWPHE